MCAVYLQGAHAPEIHTAPLHTVRKKQESNRETATKAETQPTFNSSTQETEASGSLFEASLVYRAIPRQGYTEKPCGGRGGNTYIVQQTFKDKKRNANEDHCEVLFYF